jgi:hypothetical protein
MAVDARFPEPPDPDRHKVRIAIIGLIQAVVVAALVLVGQYITTIAPLKRELAKAEDVNAGKQPSPEIAKLEKARDEAVQERDEALGQRDEAVRLRDEEIEKRKNVKTALFTTLRTSSGLKTAECAEKAAKTASVLGQGAASINSAAASFHMQSNAITIICGDGVVAFAEAGISGTADKRNLPKVMRAFD